MNFGRKHPMLAGFIVLLACAFAGLAAGWLFGWREVSLISKGISASHPTDPKDGLPIIHMGYAVWGLGWGCFGGMAAGVFTFYRYRV